MYLDFYGFQEKPFSLTPDPRFLFLSKNHKEAFAHLMYGINSRAGFILLTGEVGSGKTTVLRALLSQLNTDQYRTALIFNPCLSPLELIQNINRELGIPTGPSFGSNLLDTLNPFLLQQNAEGRTVVLAVDEAQDLEAPVLEQIRLISNLETDTDKLIQIVLAGQPEFVEVLERTEMRQLSQRITVRYHLQPMDFEDSVAYIHHRLQVAGKKTAVSFSVDALKQIYDYSRGLPRLINAACDRALLGGYSKGATEISSRIAAAGINDMRGYTTARARKRRLMNRRLILISALVVLAVLCGVGVALRGPHWIGRLNIFRSVEESGKHAEFSRIAADELGKIPEPESARRAFNILADLWGVQPVPESGTLNQLNGMKLAALDRQLLLYRFSGNLGALLRYDYPALLELNIPGVQGKRFISLIGIKNENFFAAPPIAGKKSLSLTELEMYWSGQGFLLWRDPLNLLPTLTSLSQGDHIKKLQELLREAGVYNRDSTGVYGDNTRSAVRKFQSLAGIDQDGLVGSQTLMVLYGSISRFKVPRLSK